MNWPTFQEHVAGSSFFAALDAAAPEERSRCWPWLRLLRTPVIEEWARSSTPVRSACRSRASEY
jgi:hypothetical protein